MPYEAELEIHQIHPNPRNKNVHTEESVDQLAANIKAYLLINPISVSIISASQYEIIAGERRWRAFQKLGRKKIPSRIYEAGMDDLTIDGMRLSENRIRAFDLIAECQELANLHRQGKSTTILARDFGEGATTTGIKVGIGYFPENIVRALKGGNARRNGKVASWSLNFFSDLLPLRRPQGFMHISELNRNGQAIPLDNLYDYSEIERVIEKVNHGEIELGEELRAYVATRRLELTEAAQDTAIEVELEMRFAAAKSNLEQQVAEQTEVLKQQIGAEHQERLTGLQTQLAQTIREAQQMRDQHVRLEVSHSDEVHRLRESMSEAHRKELEQKEKSFSGQIAQLQKELATARQDRDKSLRDAEARLKRDYDRKVAALESSAGKTQEEAAAAREIVAELQQSFDQRLKEKEQEINRRFEEQTQSLRSQMEIVTAERERWKREVVSRDEQLRMQGARVAELQRDHENQIAERQKDIAAKDKRITELVRQMAGVEAEALKKSTAVAEKEAQAKAAEYHKQLDAEYDRKRQALEASFAQRQKALEIKVKKTGDDAINHFLDIINKLDASVRLVVYDLAEHLDRHQHTDVVLGLRRIETKVTEALQYLDGLEAQTMDVEATHG